MVDAPSARSASPRRPANNPLGLGLLLLLVGLPLCLLFAPMGIGLVLVAVVMVTWGIVMVIVRR